MGVESEPTDVRHPRGDDRYTGGTEPLLSDPSLQVVGMVRT